VKRRQTGGAGTLLSQRRKAERLAARAAPAALLPRSAPRTPIWRTIVRRPTCKFHKRALRLSACSATRSWAAARGHIRALHLVCAAPYATRWRRAGVLKSFAGLSASIFTAVYLAAFRPDAAGFLACMAAAPLALGAVALPLFNAVPFAQGAAAEAPHVAGDTRHQPQLQLAGCVVCVWYGSAPPDPDVECRTEARGAGRKPSVRYRRPCLPAARGWRNMT